MTLDIKGGIYEPELFQLVYISRITTLGLTQISVLSDIAIASTKNNKKNGITGVLYYGNGYFFQCIEGNEKALTNLKNVLLMDRRHDQINILDFSSITERHFNKWIMRSSITENNVASNSSRATKKIKFHPERWKEDDWHDFYSELYHHYKQHALPAELENLQLTPTKKSITFYRILRENKSFINIQVSFLIGLTVFIVLIIYQ